MNAEALDNRSGALLRVLLVDPSPMSRTCFAAAMSGCPAIHVQGVDQIEAEELDRLTRLPDIIVLQLSGQELSERQLSRRLELCHERYPTAAMLILAEKAPADMCLAALAQNVSGYLTSDHGVDSVIAALQLVAVGLVVFPRLNFQQLPSQSLRPPNAAAVSAIPAPYSGGFTSRQQQVFELILDGLSNKKIAKRLGVAESTVKVHVRAIMQRTSVSSRTQLVSQVLGNRG